MDLEVLREGALLERDARRYAIYCDLLGDESPLDLDLYDEGKRLRSCSVSMEDEETRCRRILFYGVLRELRKNSDK